MDCQVASSSRGITLLELIFALFLFASLVPLFVGIWSKHHRAVQKSAGVLAATNICQLILEQSMEAGYDGVDAMAATTLADRTITLRTTITDSSVGPSSTRSFDKDFVWTMTVDTPSTEPTLQAGEKLVTVEIQWEERGDTHKNQASTLLVQSP
jgi:type II secretory pathway pseudopilin PulG